jgi:hypothetical protein
MAALIGHDLVVTLTTDSTNALQFGGMALKLFEHDASYVAMTSTVYVEDFPGAHHDTYRVELKYPATALLLVTTTLATIIATAEAAVTAALAAGVGGITGGVSNSLVTPTPVDAVSGTI